MITTVILQAVQLLTSAMQGNAPLLYNAFQYVRNSTLEADDPSDALSEASIQQQHNHTAVT